MVGAVAVVSRPVRAVARLRGWRGRRRARRLAEVVRDARTIYGRLTCLEVALDGPTRARMRREAVHVAVGPFRVASAMALAALPLGVLGLVAMLAVVSNIEAAYPTMRGADGAAVGLAVLGVLSALLYGPERVAVHLGLREPRQAPWSAAALGLAAGILWWARSPAADGLPAESEYGLVLTGTLGVALGTVGVLTFAVMWGVMRLALRGRSRARSDSVVVAELAAALDAVASDAAWADAGQRAEAARRLERAATVVEGGLPERLHSDDPATRRAVRDWCARVAAALREIQMSVLVPGATTPAAVREVVTAAVDALVSGRLQDLPTADPPPRRTRRQVAGVAARTAVLAAVPAAVFGALQASTAAVEGAAAGYVAAACLVWAVVTVVAALDPLFRDKVAAVRDAVGLLRP